MTPELLAEIRKEVAKAKEAEKHRSVMFKGRHMTIPWRDVSMLVDEVDRLRAEIATLKRPKDAFHLPHQLTMSAIVNGIQTIPIDPPQVVGPGWYTFEDGQVKQVPNPFTGQKGQDNAE